MKLGSIFFLRSVIYLLGAGVLGICIFLLPTIILSGSAGYYLPIFIGMYISAIPFFIALKESLNLLRYIDTNKVFTELSVMPLRKIKFCAGSITTLYTVGMPYIIYAADRDDAPGAVAIGLVIIFASMVIAVFATVLQKLLQRIVEIKSENDLTV